MREQIEDFIIHLKTVRNTSENTLLSYRRDLYKLSDYMAKRGITDAGSVTEQSFEQFSNALFLMTETGL